MYRSCPAPDRLKQVLLDSLPEREEAELNQHLAGCTDCQGVLDGLVSGETLWPDRLRQFSKPQRPDAALEAIMAELKYDGMGGEEKAMSDESPVRLDFLKATDEPGFLGRLDHYHILEVVGRGGMGIVLKAVDSALQRVVAIKVLARHLADNAAARRRFTREARAAAAVSHDHIVTIHAVESASNPPYLVMQFISGKSLQQRIDATGAMDLKEILRIGMQTASGLAAAHAQGLVHRDIKPANILLENGIERVKITDFGLARAVDDASLTESGIVAGTPQFMAPEQASGDSVDHRADLFSLGSVMYAMCTGRPPFRATTAMGVLKRVCDETPRSIRELNPELPSWLAQIIHKLHAKNPADRYQSASEVSSVLERHLAELQHAPSLPAPEASGAALPVTEALATSGVIAKRFRSSRSARPWKPWVLIATLGVVLAGGLAAAESAGVTHLAQTIVRIARGDGTVLIEMHDPDARVTIDGQEIVIGDGDRQEVRLRPGVHELVATKTGEPDQRFPITLSRGGRETVRIRFEVAAGSTAVHLNERSSVESAGVPGKPTSAIRPRHVLVAGKAGAWSVTLSPAGKYLATTGADSASGGVVRLWNAATFEQVWRIEEEHGIRRAAIDPSGKTIATAEDDHAVRIRDIATGNVQHTLRSHAGPVRDVVFSHDGRWLFTASADKLVHEWDLTGTGSSPSMRWVFSGSTESLDALDVSPDGRFVAAGGEDRIVRVWDRRTGQLKWTLPGAGPEAGGSHTGPVPAARITDVAFSPDGRFIAASSMDQLVYIWEMSTGKVHGILKHHGGGVSSVAFAAEGRFMVTASWDQSAVIWDAATHRPLATYQANENQCFGALLFDSGRQLATAHRNGQLMVWDVASYSGAEMPGGLGPASTEPGTARQVHVRLQAAADGSFKSMELAGRTLKHTGEVVDGLFRARIDAGLLVPIEAVITSDLNLNPDVVQSIIDAARRAGVHKVTSQVVPGGQKTRDERSIHDSLTRKISIAIDHQPVIEAARQWEKDYGVEIVFDHQALKDAVIDPTTAISLSRNEIPLSEALDALLGPIDAAWIVHHGVVWITSPLEVSDLFAETLVYELVRDDADRVIQNIMETVDPDSWDVLGGHGAIASFGDRLIIRQSQSVHRRIGRLYTEQLKPVPMPEVTAALVRERGRDSFETRVELNLENESLGNLVKQLRVKYGVDLDLDARALKEEGMGPDTPVSLSISGVSFGSLLELLVDQLGCSWTMQGNVLVITTKLDADERMHKKSYDVRRVLERVAGDAADPTENLIMAIQQTVAPSSWSDVGGNGIIRTGLNAGTIDIVQSWRTHARIESLLEALAAGLE